MATFGHRKHSRDFAIAISAGRLPMGIRERIIAVRITLPLWVLLLIAAPTLVAAQSDMARMKSDYRRPPPAAVERQVLEEVLSRGRGGAHRMHEPISWPLYPS